MTPTQLPLTGLELKEQGIASLERHDWVRRAREAAVSFCSGALDVTSDDVHFMMEIGTLDTPPHVNCFGAIFHDKRFAWTGNYVKSTRREAHYRDIKVWRLA